MVKPLQDLKIVELAGIGPAPFGVMLLADLGADVVRVDRTADTRDQRLMNSMSRGRRSIGVDIREPGGRDVVRRLAETADIFVEPFRPGVAERLGVGPSELLELNPQLIYARVTGFGQSGPLAERAGHDINYLALAGALHPIGRPDSPPPPPLNLLADFAGGGLYLTIGILAAVLDRARTGVGQIVDVAMVDGVAHLTTFFQGLLALGEWTIDRGSNFLDGGAPYYDTYATSDGGYVAVGAIEPRFYETLMCTLGLSIEDFPQHDRGGWETLRGALAETFRSRTRDEWEEAFRGKDACVSPVLSLREAPDHAANASRKVFSREDGRHVPMPAPRFSRGQPKLADPAPRRGADTDLVLAELGLEAEEIARLRSSGAVG